MQIYYKKEDLIEYLEIQRKHNKTIGFVPTMGALHRGHVSLVDLSSKLCDISVVSVFVNPNQFNDSSDLKNYPRDIDSDLELLAERCTVVFIPSVEEIYPEPDTRVFDFDGIDKVMEGEHRPGHFNGVAQVVSKLFDIVKPHKAIFGQKDFQQVAIIKKMVEKLNFSIEIISAPIIRETDGLAMSSRNRLLEKKYREIACEIFNTISESKNQKDFLNVKELKSWVNQQINKTELLKLEYFEIVDHRTLLPIESFDSSKNAIACIAVWAGKVRLIDNIIYNS
ncbi:MAG: pantoate--beta-alanine ligase [Salinivirgaceae bacterium]|nr:pantoate--beta-alanine ligase [Salinivirgaceae bacterium]